MPKRLTPHVALLRAINLASHNTVSMTSLRAVVSGLGFDGVQSILQTGNLIFGSHGRTPDELERLLEEATARELGLDTQYFVRTASEWEAVIEVNPFPQHAEGDPSHLLVACLKQAPDPERIASLQRAIVGREQVRVVGRHAYIVYPDGIGRSRLSMAVVERALGTRGTGRNWNTVLRIGAHLGLLRS